MEVSLNYQLQILNFYGFRWFKCKLKPPKKVQKDRFFEFYNSSSQYPSEYLGKSTTYRRNDWETYFDIFMGLGKIPGRALQVEAQARTYTSQTQNKENYQYIYRKSCILKWRATSYVIVEEDIQVDTTNHHNILQRRNWGSVLIQRISMKS